LELVDADQREDGDDEQQDTGDDEQSRPERQAGRLQPPGGGEQQQPEHVERQHPGNGKHPAALAGTAHARGDLRLGELDLAAHDRRQVRGRVRDELSDGPLGNLVAGRHEQNTNACRAGLQVGAALPGHAASCLATYESRSTTVVVTPDARGPHPGWDAALDDSGDGRSGHRPVTRSSGAVSGSLALTKATRLARSSGPPVRSVPWVKTVKPSPPSWRKLSVATR